jgi:hypothetical protein
MLQENSFVVLRWKEISLEQAAVEDEVDASSGVAEVSVGAECGEKGRSWTQARSG